MTKNAQDPVRHRLSHSVTKGWIWLKTAALLPGESLHLALALYSLVSAQQNHRIKLGNLASHEFGVDRNPEIPRTRLARARRPCSG